MSQIRINKNFINNVIKLALNEDLYPSGDITSSLIKDNKIIKLKLISNQKAIIGGLEFAKQTFKLIDKKIKFFLKKKEGSSVKKNDLIAIIQGKAQSILIGERVALNFISHISGVATKTNQFVKLVKRKLKNLAFKNITIMGTAFKPNTDDVRDSLSIELIRKFLKVKAKIIVYDPRAIDNTKKIFGTKIIYKNSVSEALEKSECVIFMTYWKEFENIDNRTIKHMKRKLIIDCRRIFADKNMGKEYFALGIGQ